jgi:PAS domain S-box-containing protein
MTGSVQTSYDPLLVALSVVIASFASYTALDLSGRVRSRSRTTWAWVAAASMAMGGGIWSMHFVGMLAFSMPMPITYNISLTAVSLLLAVAVTGAALAVVSWQGAGRTHLALSGLFMGIGIAGMHYTGMAAMRMGAGLSYDVRLVALSILIAVGTATVALWLATRRHRTGEKMLAGIVMGAAIAGMHYTGMAAARFTAMPGMQQTQHVARHAELEQTTLAIAITLTTFIILFLALIASSVDRHLMAAAEREAASLRLSEERFRSLYRTTPVPLHSSNPDGVLTEVSEHWLELLGYERGEVIGRRITDFLTAESAQSRTTNDLMALFETGELRGAEYQFVRKSGEIVDTLVSCHAERDAAGQVVRVVGAVVDITARKRAEDALRQAQKMEAVGQLTGGVAHDFNNLLAAISGNHELALRALNVGEDVRAGRHISSAQRSVGRAAALTQRLLAFSRRQPLKPQPVDVPQLVTGMTDLLRRTIGENIAVETVIAGGVWQTLADPNQLEAALLNLAINARDAMPDGGKLIIETSNAHLDAAYAARRDEVKPGQYVQIALTDTGIGMPREVAENAFEPFFTTKQIGEGSGLGLSQVFGFVKQSGGHVTIYSQVGLGTTVRIYLPRLLSPEPPLGAPEVELEENPANYAGHETILVVEDDEDVRAFTSESLRGLGYRVLEAGDASSALNALENIPEITMLFTDVGLPGINGRQLAEEARRRVPSLPVLYTSGYASRGIVTNGLLEPGIDLLSKPFTIIELASRIRRVIDAVD